MTKKTLIIEAIQHGTVIDHIPSGQALRILDLLKIREHSHAVTLGLNLESKRLGKKDIIKITGRALTELEASNIAVFAPKARINIIQDYHVVEKMMALLPRELKTILICPNTNCVSNSESIPSLFRVDAVRGDIRLSCHYCERTYGRSDIQEYRT